MRTTPFVAIALVASPAAAEPAVDPVRFDYRAPGVCPDAEAFARRVSERTTRVRLGEPGELSRTFVVEVAFDEDGASARVEFTDTRGTSVVRAVRGETCDEVVSAIALVTALAIEAGTDAEGESVPPIAPAPSAAAPPIVRPSPVSPRKRPLPAPEPDAVVGSVGVETGVSTWLGPPPALGLGVFGEVGAYAGASGRLTLLGTTASTLVPLEGTSRYRRGDFRALLARIEGCPVAMLLGAGFRLVPCVAVGLGALEGAGQAETVSPARSKTIVWADVVPALRLDFTVADSLVFFAEGELGLPLVRHRFVFEGPEDEVWNVPVAGAGASFGMAWRFP
jgi:hypothetical protein